MDSQFENYFSERANEVFERAVAGLGAGLASPEARRVIEGQDDEAQRVVRNVVDSASTHAKESGHPLRGDAELLLYMSFRELVARPLTVVRGLSAADISDAIESDVSRIVRRASDLSAPQEAVSAHQIVNAVSQLWEELQTLTFGIWD
jgi:hypothetical protein